MANDSPYGLAAYVFGRDLERCLYVAERLEVGRDPDGPPAPGSGKGTNEGTTGVRTG